VAESDSNNKDLLDFGEFLTVFAREKEIEAATDQSVALRISGNFQRSRANADSALAGS
jgi:hypothetical protein